VSLKNYCFSINSFHQAYDVIKICKKYKITPILHIKYFIIIKFGVEWIIELKGLLNEHFHKKDFKILVDVKRNYGLFISLVQNRIEYIEVKADSKIIKKLNQIGETNKVLINPNFSIVDLNNIKNFDLKIKKIINK
tara:strand:+ start:1534 stop:1941 length:408 start_codon:yes stop_codon:yes gene_type:complete